MRTWAEMRRTYVNARLQELQGVTPPLRANWRQQRKDQAHAEFNDFVKTAIAAAIEADRAQLRTLAAEAHEAIAQIEQSTTSPDLDDVTDARDNAGDVLHRLVAYVRGKAFA